ncbi:hypothetical protein ONZ45_g11197 [Pleurotus djamor]|nr:hypothetical protein ONZ45_g11197 [Pleurotus djamor]
MSPSSTLLQDAYSLIAGYLRNDKASLKACSLVASAWRPSSQRLLHQTMIFRSVLLSGSGEQGPEKIRLLLDASSHLLRYVRTIVIRGCHIDHLLKGQHDAPFLGVRPLDPSLAGFLTKLDTLSLPSLIRVELHHLIWTKLKPDLQRELIRLIQTGSVEEVCLVKCIIHIGVQWLRFVGPETRSLQFRQVELIGDFNAEQEASIIDIPVSSAQNLTDLDMGELCGDKANKWMLRSPQAQGGSIMYPNSPATMLSSRSWRESLATLSLCCRAEREGPLYFLELAWACSNLKKLKLIPLQGVPPTFPLQEISCIPTLQDLTIFHVPSGGLRWLISSLTVIDPLLSPSTTSFITSATNLKAVHIYMWVELTSEAAMRGHIDISEMLEQVRELDGVVAGMPDVEFYMNLWVSANGLRPGPAQIRYEESKKAVVGLKDGVKALKLNVV